MTFLNDIGKKLSQAGQDAVKKAYELAETAKYNAQIAMLECKIKDLYTELGESAYCMSKGEPSDDGKTSGIIAKIDELNVSIAAIRQLIERAKENYLCPKCGSICQSGVFCSKCGVNLAEAFEAAAKEKAEKAEKEAAEKECCLDEMCFCDGCGAEIDPEDIYCSGCGKKLEKCCDCGCDCDDDSKG